LKPTLNISNLKIGYNNKPIVKEINVISQSNKLIALIGRNGKGKSTLLKTISGLLPPINGDITFNDQVLTLITEKDRAKLLSIVLSNNLVLENITVHDFVAYGRFPYTNWLGINTIKDNEIIEKAIQLCGINTLQNRFYNTLSDGEKQKVNIARAIAQDTPFIILDEPTAHLDLINKVEILKLLKSLSDQYNKMIIISTHQIEMALQLCDEIWTIGNSNLEVNTPLDLINSNKLEKLFGNENVTFNKEKKGFEIR
jgi:iron complex transport system ATP-binding protein